MKRKGVAVAAAVIGLTLAGCSGSRPGSQDVYDRIDGSTDCAQLQQEFDTASASHDRAASGSDAAEVATSYMRAADDRMQDLGCY